MSAQGHATGWDLVTAAQGGDREAFGQLYGRYADPVARYVGHRVPDRHLAQDMTAETFTRALRRVDSVSDQGRNLLADHWRSSRYQRNTTPRDRRRLVAAAVRLHQAGHGARQIAVRREVGERRVQRWLAQHRADPATSDSGRSSLPEGAA